MKNVIMHVSTLGFSLHALIAFLSPLASDPHSLLAPQLASVYTCYLRSILSHAKCGAAVWSEPAHVKRLAVCMVELYEQLQAKFPPDETQRHLLLTPRELSAWAFGLLRYGTESGRGRELHFILYVFDHEPISE